MIDEYNIRLRCATCGCDDQFEANENQSYVKCTFCNREYLGGIEELKELNEELIVSVKEEMENDAIKFLQEEIEKAFKRNKYIKIK